MMGAFGIMFSLVFIFIMVIMIIMIVKGLSEWHKNNNSPILTVDAKIVGRRTEVSHYHQNMDNNIMINSSTTYYITFEVESKDRIELRVSGREYGQLIEKDEGKLTFQGTRYKGFVRK